jgi:hypothetical protein
MSVTGRTNNQKTEHRHGAHPADFPDRPYVMTGPIHAYGWPYQIAYEWGATIKALTVQRSC